MTLKIIRTSFKNLVKALDAYLKITDREEHDFYNQFNTIDVLNEVVSLDEKPVGFGAIKKFDNFSVEGKRMFVSLEKRANGIVQKIELRDLSKRIGI
jgi:hypothetical protein